MQSEMIAATSDVIRLPQGLNGRKWHRGAQIVQQKEILVTDERSDDEDYTNATNTDTSLSL